MSAVLSCGFAQAKVTDVNPIDKSTAKVVSLQESDANFLFDNIDTSKVVVLSQQEMSETKGEF